MDAGMDQDQLFMRAALAEAEAARAKGEVPIGAVLVLDGDMLFCGLMAEHLSMSGRFQCAGVAQCACQAISVCGEVSPTALAEWPHG